MKLRILIPLVLCPALYLAQDGSDWQQLPPSDYLAIDRFDHRYRVRHNELQKLDSQNKVMSYYSNPVLGEIASVDVLNPLSIYVFFQITNRLIVLDNRLNESSQMNFNDYNFTDVQLVSFSDQETVWLYDQTTDRLHRFHLRDKKVTNRSLNITQLLGNENRPTQMQSTVDQVYLLAPGVGVLVFDPTGAFQSTLPLPQIHCFDVHGEHLFAATKNEVIRYHLRSGKLKVILETDPDHTVQQVLWSERGLYLFTGRYLKRWPLQ